PGTVRQVMLVPGQIVEPGTILVALDVSVEAADLEAQAAQADLATTTLARLERLRQADAASQEEVDQARAARDVAVAQIARTRAIVARKTIRAPFRARVGLGDARRRDSRQRPAQGAGRRSRLRRGTRLDWPHTGA